MAKYQFIRIMSLPGLWLTLGLMFGPAHAAAVVNHTTQEASAHPQSLPQPQLDIAYIAKDYFDVYAQRRDFSRLMDFYADNAVLEDIVYGNHLKNKQEIKAFLNWPGGEFKVLDNKQALTITNQVIQGHSVVTRGHFNTFEFNGNKMGPWRFVIWLDFDQHGRIIRHQDWINYTPRKQFLGGKNMNTLIRQ